jgi:hypothetical protein
MFFGSRYLLAGFDQETASDRWALWIDFDLSPAMTR